MKKYSCLRCKETWLGMDSKAFNFRCNCNPQGVFVETI